MKRHRSRTAQPPRGPREPLDVGQKIRDRQTQRIGTVCDTACQYSHPKVDPVYSYLVRWDDGQVQALSEAAFDGGYGLELVD